MTIALILLAILALSVIILGTQLYLQHRKLRRIAINLKQSNIELNNANSQLQQSVEKNEEANKHLTEASIIKEKCICTFFTLCMQYIESLNNIRTKTNKLLRNHQYDELAAMTRSNDALEAALQNLYGQFDSMFLTIYPGFISKFNALLKPGYQVTQPKEGTLTTPLRIFALIRLGIDDSGKISRLLSLANSTVYNYRTRFRNHAVCERTAFEDQVRRIV